MVNILLVSALFESHRKLRKAQLTTSERRNLEKSGQVLTEGVPSGSNQSSCEIDATQNASQGAKLPGVCKP
jgi:hypothetical protein